MKAGDNIWLGSKNLKLSYPTRKLAPNERDHSTSQKLHAYHLELPNQWCIHLVFHVVLLTPSVKTEMHGTNYLSPPPDLIDGQEEHKVEVIIHRRQ